MKIGETYDLRIATGRYSNGTQAVKVSWVDTMLVIERKGIRRIYDRN